ncbi:hypothetical protein PR048_014926 [Dryococelus australis]|uniref:DDE-1 domain-containing protein n=1 Tax=Dryococelus australis TaxID=614101 RepID=A0ABQ9HFR8_9NEOP|nr:hypothetical protein PR048_014926 [Dryococelus australis]
MDNLFSHFSCNISNFCNDNDIRFVALPKNSTHFTQPLDVAVFHLLKSEWCKILTAWRNKVNKGALPKVYFPPLLKSLASEKQDSFHFKKIKFSDNCPRGTDANAADTSMEEPFIGLLCEMCYVKNTKKKTGKRKRNTMFRNTVESFFTSVGCVHHLPANITAKVLARMFHQSIRSQKFPSPPVDAHVPMIHKEPHIFRASFTRWLKIVLESTTGIIFCNFSLPKDTRCKHGNFYSEIDTLLAE